MIDDMAKPIQAHVTLDLWFAPAITYAIKTPNKDRKKPRARPPRLKPPPGPVGFVTYFSTVFLLNVPSRFILFFNSLCPTLKFTLSKSLIFLPASVSKSLILIREKSINEMNRPVFSTGK